MTKHIMLPEKENFIRLRDCDFNNIKEYDNDAVKIDLFNKQLKNSKLPGTLKKILNPILVLFYYDNTRKNILTEFFESNSVENLESGEEEDSIFSGEDDMKFNFGFVNLDLEKEILKTFQKMTGLNPFSWAKIEEDYEGYPFIIFYYNSLPQFIYEGTVDSTTIKLEFKNWRKELIEMENKDLEEVKNKEIKREGYFVALENDKPFKGIVKGKTYWVIVSENTSGIYDYIMKPV